MSTEAKETGIKLPRHRPPRCNACGEITLEKLRDECGKTICRACEGKCAWCGSDDAPKRDESGARSCERCMKLAEQEWERKRAARAAGAR